MLLALCQLRIEPEQLCFLSTHKINHYTNNEIINFSLITLSLVQLLLQ